MTKPISLFGPKFEDVVDALLKTPKNQSPLDIIIEWAKKERHIGVRETAELAERELYRLRSDYKALREHHRDHHDEKA